MHKYVQNQNFLLITYRKNLTENSFVNGLIHDSDILLPIRATRNLFSATFTSLEFELTGATGQNNKDKIITAINKLKIENEVHKWKAEQFYNQKC